MATQTIERMAVEVDGEGDAVVLVHGLGGTSNTFTPQVARLAGRFRVVRPDLPGSGRSPLPGPLSIPGLVDALARLCARLGIERAHFVGHSLGTIVCQHLAVAHPGLVRSLALLGPILAPPDAGRQGIRDRARRARAEGMQGVADAVCQAALSGDTRANHPIRVALVREMLMRQDPEGYAATCEALASAEAADLARITCPTLLVTGDEDAIAPAGAARAMAERIRDARVLVLPKCGHWTTIERWREVTDALLERLARRA